MISAVIITKDEASHIYDCIASIDDIVNEIIVVDAHSTDETRKIASSASSKVTTISKEWSGYGAARNHGADSANHDWILSIDADERCDQVLADSISTLKPSSDHVFAMKRINIYKGTKIKYGLLAPEVKPRIYNRLKCDWDDSLVHERLRSRKSGDIVSHPILLDGELTHYAYDEVSSHRSKLTKYAELAARQWIKTNRTVTSVEASVGPVYHFIRNYIGKKGFLDRAYGLETSITAMSYQREKYKYYRLLKSAV